MNDEIIENKEVWVNGILLKEDDKNTRKVLNSLLNGGKIRQEEEKEYDIARSVEKADNSQLETYRVVDNILGENGFKMIRNVCMDQSIPWKWNGTTYGDNELLENGDEDPKKFSFGFQPSEHDPIYKIMETTILNMMDSAGYEINNIWRIRLGLIQPVGDMSMLHEAHVDSPYAHNAGLLYITDSDGPTTLYNNKRTETHVSPDYDEFHHYITKVKDKLSIMDEITPKANRLLLFNGDYYHASSTPTNVPRRVALNFNWD
jgi:hypothetical protein